MPSRLTDTAVLKERFAEEGTVSVRLPVLPHPGSTHENGDSGSESASGVDEAQYPDDLNTTAFSFVKELAADLESGKLRLPSLPEVVIRARRALTDEDSSREHVVRVLGSDPVLAARVVRRANSAQYYRCAEPVNGLPSAVQRIGYQGVLNIAMSMALEQLFHGQVPESIRPYLKSEWQHSTRIAALSHILAARVTTVNPDEAFLTGLLHGIGRLCILMRAQDNPELLADTDAFRLILQAWHPEVGAAVIRYWEFSDEMVSAILDYETCKPDSADTADLTVVVAVASRLADCLNPVPPDGTHAPLPTCPALNLDTEAAVEVVAGALEEIAHLHHTLGL